MNRHIDRARELHRCSRRDGIQEMSASVSVGRFRSADTFLRFSLNNHISRSEQIGFQLSAARMNAAAKRRLRWTQEARAKQLLINDGERGRKLAEFLYPHIKLEPTIGPSPAVS